MRNLWKFKGKKLSGSGMTPMLKLQVFNKAEVRLLILKMTLEMKLLILKYVTMASIYWSLNTLKYKKYFKILAIAEIVYYFILREMGTSIVIVGQFLPFLANFHK